MSDNNDSAHQDHRQTGANSFRNTVFDAPVQGYIDSVTNAEVVNGSVVQNIVYL